MPTRLLCGGFFTALNHSQHSFYIFLVLADDRDGVSFHSYDRICTPLDRNAKRVMIDSVVFCAGGRS